MKRNNWKKIFTYGMTAVLTIQLSGILIYAQDHNSAGELSAAGVTAQENITKDNIPYEGTDTNWTDTEENTDADQSTIYIEESERIVESEINEDTYEIEEIEETVEDEEDDTTSQKTKKDTREKKEAKTTADTAPSYSEADLRLLSALIYCESNGEPYAGKLAVGIVVMNRKRSSKFPNTVKGVIEQPNQFGPVRNGSLNRALSRYDSGKFNSTVDKDCIKAAKEALSGVKTVTYKGTTKDFSSYLYFNGKVSGAKYQIANHQFK